MALPTTRDITLSPDDPVPSALLNTLQDQIIGGKHPIFEIPIAACDFAPEAGSSASLGNGQWTFGAVSVVAAACRVRAGAKIVQAVVEVNRGGAGTIIFSLLRRANGSGVAVAIGTVSLTTGTGLATMSLSANYQVLPGEQVYLRVEVNNAAHIVVRAALFISVL
jgi:hypothetical protein